MRHACVTKMAAYLLTLSGFALLAAARGQDQLCNDKLIRGLPDDHLSASSSLTTSTLHTGPDRGRLNTTQVTLNNGTVLAGGWAPGADNKAQFIQADFDELTMINGVFTQGRNQGNGSHVTLFKMEYTEDGKTWQTVNNDIGVEQIFGGNKDADSVQYNPLDCPIFAKGIRIIPQNWDSHIGLRFEVNGCYLDNTVVVVPTGVSPSSTFLPGIVTPFSLTTTTNASTAPITTTRTSSTLITTLSTKPSTTKRTTTLPTTTTVMTTPTTTKQTTPSTTKQTTPSTIITTTVYNFHPGVLNPFGTTQSTSRPTVNPFMPGIPTPFGPNAAIG